MVKCWENDLSFLPWICFVIPQIPFFLKDRGKAHPSPVHSIGNEIILTERTIHELEAESVVYVVCRHFGLNGLSSPNYVALHGATAELVLEHLERIRNTAAEIIRALEVDEVNVRKQAGLLSHRCEPTFQFISRQSVL